MSTELRHDVIRGTHDIFGEFVAMRHRGLRGFYIDFEHSNRIILVSVPMMGESFEDFDNEVMNYVALLGFRIQTAIGRHPTPRDLDEFVRPIETMFKNVQDTRKAARRAKNAAARKARKRTRR